MVSVLLKYLPQEILDSIMLYLDTKDIRRIGKKRVSEFVWLRKKDKSWLEACENKNAIGFQYIINQSKNIKINPIFREIIKYECFDIVKYCIKRNADVDLDNGYPLKYNSYRNNLDVVRYLIDECGANIQCLTEHWEMARIAARGSLDVIKYLVDEKNINIKSSYYSILEASADNDHLDIIKYCIENNSIINDDNTIALPSNIASENSTYINKYLADVTDIYKGIVNALNLAAENGNLDIVKLCIECFTNVYSNNKYNNSFKAILKDKDVNTVKYHTYADINKALDVSIENSKLSVAEYLALSGTKQHTTINAALGISINHGKLRFIKYLVKQGADIHRNINDNICTCINNGHLNVLRYLVNNGVNIDVVDINKILEFNIKSYSTGIIRFLIENGGDQNIALLSSIKSCHFVIVKYFIKCGVDINKILRLSVENKSYSIVKHITKDKAYKNAALQFCIEYNNLYITKRLVWYGVDIHANQNAALASCVEYGDRLDIMRFLLRNGDKDKILQFSVEQSNLFILKYIINLHRINITENNNAVLCSAIEHNNDADVMKYLVRESIKYGTNITIIHNDKEVKFKTMYKHILEYVAQHIDKLHITNNEHRKLTISIND